MAHASGGLATYCCPRGPHRRCHRCRSKAGWRDRQVLSGCGSTDIGSATYVNGRSKAASWTGFKGESGQPMIQTVNDSVERTHRRY